MSCNHLEKCPECGEIIENGRLTAHRKGCSRRSVKTTEEQ